MKALGIGPGDEVITAPNTFVATAGAIVSAGATPVFVDVNEEYNIDPCLIEGAVTSRTRGIIPVHLTGNPAHMSQILAIADEHNLFVIEDAAQAIGASITGQPVGSFGIAGCFSLHPLKNLNAWGDGGVVVTNSKKLLDRIRLLRNHGLRNRNECEFFGYNSRLDTVQAIVAKVLMEDLDWITSRRIDNARAYDDYLRELADYITVPARHDGVRQVFHTYVVQARNRDALLMHLEEAGIEVKVHYPIPIHLQKASEYLGYTEGDFPVCEAQSKSIVTLPVHQHLTDEQIVYVVENIGAFYEG